MRIYVESTIPSYVVARPASDVLQAARQQLARDWWHHDIDGRELYVSSVVIREVSLGDSVQAAARLALIEGLPALETTERSEELTGHLLDSGLIPEIAATDAVHIAIATVQQMDFLVTWNCKHIANGAIRVRLRQLVEARGYRLPEIVTPEELQEYRNDGQSR